MNYHLMVDDKFIDGFIEIAEKVAPKKNIYLFTFNSPGNYAKSKNGLIAPYGSPVLKSIIKNISVEDRVFIHWFHEEIMQIINEINSSIPIYLFFWGGDFIEHSKGFINFNLDTLTKRYSKYYEIQSYFHWSKNPMTYLRMTRDFFEAKKKAKGKMEKEFAIRKRFLNRLNYFCHWNILDYEIVCQAYNTKPILINFFYGIEFKEILNDVCNKNDANDTLIWLGNSDTITNNHLDAISVLKQYLTCNVHIICPLSYGNKEYGDYISKVGQKVFGNRWISIREYMPFEHYISHLQKVNVVIMFHNRSQASGNIFLFILLGKKVYLKSKSTIYKFMTGNGIIVFDSSSIKNLSFEEFSKPLAEHEIKSNKEKILSVFSDENRIKLLDTILN